MRTIKGDDNGRVHAAFVRGVILRARVSRKDVYCFLAKSFVSVISLRTRSLRGVRSDANAPSTSARSSRIFSRVRRLYLHSCFVNSSGSVANRSRKSAESSKEPRSWLIRVNANDNFDFVSGGIQAGELGSLEGGKSTASVRDC